MKSGSAFPNMKKRLTLTFRQWVSRDLAQETTSPFWESMNDNGD